MTILLVAELREGHLHPASAKVLTAARQLGSDVHVLLATDPGEAVCTEVAMLQGVTRVRCLAAPHYRDHGVENLALPIAQTAALYTHVVFAATPFGKALAPRLAAMLDVAPVSDVIQILAPDLFVRPTYAGNVLSTVQCREPVKVLTIRPSAFAPAARSTSAAPVDVAPAGPDMGVSQRIARQYQGGARPALADAQVIVAGGQGLGSKDNFARLIYPLADMLGAAIGATRAAVDAGFAPYDWQVGQTGQIVAPELYIAIGISGAAQHVAGIRGARVVVAFNKDAEAPLLQVADYALVGDLNDTVPQWLAALQAQHPV
ncbi:electron transfer flavoprotein subunit alpha/FixB family protein [Uliginosibacterium gangwonense]|uniref:electron transfer flavoprotein subunit alpha/FixB family protein n=1 Tax=Uliginosibacterium gangwonense TaxID=392736 RepID=UPI0003756ABC|nr:electron transfer flavoprotein subunit alpha/FixB family protein [Uliginosibacterium gangwonense]